MTGVHDAIRPWVREYDGTWHFYPQGRGVNAACGHRPIAGQPATALAPTCEHCSVCLRVCAETPKPANMDVRVVADAVVDWAQRLADLLDAEIGDPPTNIGMHRWTEAWRLYRHAQSLRDDVLFITEDDAA